MPIASNRCSSSKRASSLLRLRVDAKRRQNTQPARSRIRWIHVELPAIRAKIFVAVAFNRIK